MAPPDPPKRSIVFVVPEERNKTKQHPNHGKLEDC